jgi:hypothetical protein
MLSNIGNLRVPMQVLLEGFEKRWCVVCYLIINWRIDELWEKAQVRIPTEFYKELAEHLYAYVYEAEMPPAQIAPTIMNIADDLARGDPVKLRAGDYIAVQDYFRSEGRLK